MTELKQGQSVTRVAATSIRYRQLVVTVHPTYVALRRKGTRLTYTASIEAIWNLAARIAADRARLERLEAKKAKKRR